MCFYCTPAGDICRFTRQLIPLLIMLLILLLGTVGFGISLYLGLYDVPFEKVHGIRFFLPFLSAISLLILAVGVSTLTIMFIIDWVFDRLDYSKMQNPKLFKEVAKRLNPIKAKAEKLCIKITYKD
jgi:hypothetical protein